MGIRGLAEYFVVKHAGLDNLSDDTSLGGLIVGDKVRVLKDGLQKVYSQMQENVTTLPLFDRLNVILSNDNQWSDFHKKIINLTNYVEDHDLKSCFNYSTRLLDQLVKMRLDVKYDRKDLSFENRFNVQDAMERIGDHIWKAAKHILNIHDLRGLLIRIPEAERILNSLSIKPTWDFDPHGPKNPGQPFQAPVMQRYDNSLQQTKKQWEQKADIAEAREALGPYATNEEIVAFIKRKKKDHHNEIARKSTQKWKASAAERRAAEEALGENADEGQILAYLQDKKERELAISTYLVPAFKANGTRGTDEVILLWIKDKIKADRELGTNPQYSNGSEMDLSDPDILDGIRKLRKAKQDSWKSKGK